MALYKELEKLPHKSNASMAIPVAPLQERKFFGLDNNGAFLQALPPPTGTDEGIEEAKGERTDEESSLRPEPVVLTGVELKRVIKEHVKECLKKELGSMCMQL